MFLSIESFFFYSNSLPLMLAKPPAFAAHFGARIGRVNTDFYRIYQYKILFIRVIRILSFAINGK